MFLKLQGDVGILRRIRPGRVEVGLAEPNLLLAFPDDFSDRDAPPTEFVFRKRVHRMTRSRGVDHVALDHGVAGDPGERCVMTAQDVEVELQVVADLSDRRIGQKRTEHLEHGGLIEMTARVG